MKSEKCMQKFILISLIILSARIGVAQISAVTSKGDEVVLYDNGTWKYVSDPDTLAKEIPISNTRYTKKNTSSFEVKSTVTPNVSVFINPKVWSFEKSKEGHAREYTFQLKGKDAYGMLITERIGIPIEALKNLALKNAKKAAPDIKLIKEEYRFVNSVKVLFLQMNGTIQGVEFSYCGYYYSSRSSSVQFITYTARNLLNEYKASLDDLLNGLSVVEEK